MNERIKFWCYRHLPIEIACAGAIIAVASFVYLLSGSVILAAFLGSFAEGIIFYTFGYIRDMRMVEKRHDQFQKKCTMSKNSYIRNMVLKHGLSELLDTFLLRPLLIYLFVIVLGDFIVGLIVGKLIADLVFFAPAILRKIFDQKVVVVPDEDAI